jgi:MFS family permease
MGLNEAAGYVALSATALLTGFIAARAGLRPEPFYLGIAYAALGLGLSTLTVRETRNHTAHEAMVGRLALKGLDHELSVREVMVRTSFTDPSLSAASQAGMINNLNDGMAWGLLPLYFAIAGLSITRIGVLVAVYPAVWGFGQLATGAWSDRVGRRPLIVAGMWTQALAIAVIAVGADFSVWLVAMALLGVGTALVYPTLLAAVGDLAHPLWRGTAVGVYRFWRDAGFALGAILTGLVADLANASAAIWTVAALTAMSGTVVALRMSEVDPHS